MSQSKTRGWLIAATVGASIVGLGWLHTSQLQYIWGLYQGAKDRGGDSETGKAKSSAQNNQDWGYDWAIEYLSKSLFGDDVNSYPETKPKSYENNDRADHDLYAQKSMAISTEKLLKIAWISLLISVGAIILVYRTFIETKRTTATTRDIGEAQVRAYVSVSRAQIFDFVAGKNFFVEIGIKNAGQSPAIDLVSVMKMKTFEKNEVQKFDLTQLEQDQSKGTLASGGEFLLQDDCGEECSSGNIEWSPYPAKAAWATSRGRR